MKKQKELHLLIDDRRNLNTDIIARTYDSGLLCLFSLNVTHLYIDHDLGEEKSGYDLLKFLCGCISRILPNFIQLVTDNPVGRINMRNLLKDNGYSTKDGINFYK